MVVRTHKFNGRRYKIYVHPPVDGQCTTYKVERELWIMAHPRTKNGLVTALHESLHAENWAASEEVVDRVSREIGDFLWRLGYRWKH